MTRALYSLLMWLIQPLLRRKLARRGVQEPGYLQAVEERFGRYSTPPSTGWLWVHAVSLGETRAAAILLAALRQYNPTIKLLLTHGTATGRAEGARLLQPGDMQVWQPWDTPGAVARFLAHFQPVLGVLVETEVWPNMAALCQKRGVPLVLVNARLSEKTLQQAQRLAWLAQPAYAALAAVYAQTEADAARLRTLGAPVQGVFGNLKFDAQPDAAQLARGQRWRSALQKPVVLFASSREGEEALFLQNLKLFMPLTGVDADDIAIKKEAIDNIQWLMVPRHPQRFDAVAALVQQQGFTLSRRNEWGDVPAPADVWLGDSLGEMALYYGMADVALLGGSFAPLGGQNLIEAAACGCPVLLGPSVFNFAEAAAMATKAGAAEALADIASAVHTAVALAGDGERLAAMRAAALLFSQAHRGAAQKTAAALQAVQAGA